MVFYLIMNLPRRGETFVMIFAEKFTRGFIQGYKSKDLTNVLFFGNIDAFKGLGHAEI